MGAAQAPPTSGPREHEARDRWEDRNERPGPRVRQEGPGPRAENFKGRLLAPKAGLQLLKFGFDMFW